MRILVLAAAMAISASGMAAAAQPAPAAAPAIGRAEVIAAVRKAIAEHYVVADKRAALDAALAKGLKSGRYEVADVQELMRRVDEDLYAVAHDKHLGLMYDPAASAEVAKRGVQGDEIDGSAFFKALMRRQNHGVSEMRVLPGNIRYVKYDGFGWTGPESAAAIDAAMAFLRDGDAAIIDLRGNGGGSPEAVRRMTSYFVPENTLLVTFHNENAPPDRSVSEAVPGGQVRMPLYVLTSGRSASAAEEFTSHVARLGFGTLVGETTAGAANRNAHFPVPGGFLISVSVGYPELPGGGNWEGKGVAPAIAVPVDQALDRAQQAAALALMDKAAGPARTELEWAAALHGARVTPVAPRLPLDRYAGRYGPRTVAVENGALTWRRDGGPKSALVPVGPDLFALELDPRTRIRFTGTDAVTGIVIERADGTSSPVTKG